jgi:hypothetical protein
MISPSVPSEKRTLPPLLLLTRVAIPVLPSEQAMGKVRVLRVRRPKRMRFIREEFRDYFKAFPAADRLQAGHIGHAVSVASIRDPESRGSSSYPLLAKSLPGV